jgi:SAM-dependent methyltransferase
VSDQDISDAAAKRLEQSNTYWDGLGQRNPYGAILTGSAGNLRQWDLEAFLETGKADAARFVADLDRIAPALRRDRLLDFGCGVGRVTRALAAHFDAAVGVDAAPAMIARARDLHAACGNCEFVLNSDADLRRFDSGTFDVVYSRLVLQHIAPELVRRYLPELVRVLKPGGVLMFQLPDVIVDARTAYVRAPVVGSGIKQRLPRLLIRAYRHLKYSWIVETSVAQMPMYGMAHDAVLTVLREAGARVLAIAPDQSHGPLPAGYEYWLTR